MDERGVCIAIEPSYDIVESPLLYTTTTYYTYGEPIESISESVVCNIVRLEHCLVIIRH